ncbi:hypothetical protein [Actinoplanes regularis]|uniref:hypothetical protein n=1 Tax=Actinoplanes regularis TaxID=52697 RepID=UPI001178C2C5|nr:hypothetical protein [Actinoplanes regularis]GIE88579.1 hypothetical protein Are01nite_50590 [Actinoplanes regularis]
MRAAVEKYKPPEKAGDRKSQFFARVAFAKESVAPCWRAAYAASTGGDPLSCACPIPGPRPAIDVLSELSKRLPPKCRPRCLGALNKLSVEHRWVYLLHRLMGFKAGLTVKIMNISRVDFDSWLAEAIEAVE